MGSARLGDIGNDGSLSWNLRDIERFQVGYVLKYRLKTVMVCRGKRKKTKNVFSLDENTYTTTTRTLVGCNDSVPPPLRRDAASWALWRRNNTVRNLL